MTLTLRHSMSFKCHIVDTKTEKTLCNRDAKSMFSTDHYHDTCIICDKRGSFEEIVELAKKRREESDKHFEQQQELAGWWSRDKKQIARGLQEDLCQFLLEQDYQYRLEYNRIQCRKTYRGYDFYMEIKLPPTSFGAYTSGNHEISETKPYWADKFDEVMDNVS